MNKTFRKFKIRNIKSNIRQFLSVIIIVILSSMLLSGFIVNASTLETSVSRYYTETNLADMWVYVDSVTEEDEEFFESSEIEYSKRLYFETSASINNGQNNGVKIYVGNGAISNPVIESGWRGLLVDKHTADSNNIQFGIDEIKFSINFETDLGEISLDLTQKITGTMNFVESADSYSETSIFIDEESFIYYVNAELSNLGLTQQITEVPYNQILVKTDNFDETSSVIENYYSQSSSTLLFIASRDSIESVSLLETEINQAWQMIYVFPIIFLIVSVLVILTTIDQLIIQEKFKIGTLKSIGVPDKKILRHYSSYGAYLCLIGCVVGVILGIIIIPSVMFVKYRLLYSIPADYVVTNVPILWILLLVVGIILLGYLVSFVACHKILHKKPIECLRFEINLQAKNLKKTRGKFKKIPLSVKMAARNIRIKPIRTIMASIGIAGCTALLLAGFGIGDTLSNSINNDLGKVFYYDLTSSYTSEDFEENLQQVEGIESYEVYKQLVVQVQHNDLVDNVTLYELQENSHLSNIKLSNNDVIISNSVAEDLGVNVQDTIVILNGGEQIELVITGTVTTSFYNGIFVCQDLNIQSSLTTVGVWIECSDGADINAVKNQVNQINGTNSASTLSEIKQNANEQISSISTMTSTLKVFAILLAVVVLINLVFLILKERIRELATLKVLGKSLISITLSIFFEILFMSLIGMVIGLLLGYPLLILILSINKVEIINYIYHISALSFIWSILIIVLTAFVVSLFCYYKVYKINMVESLKTIE